MKRIAPLTRDASKEAEINALMTLFNNAGEIFPEGTYCHDTFNPRLFELLRSKIRSDFPPDVMQEIDYLNDVCSQKARETTQALDELQAMTRLAKKNADEAAQYRKAYDESIQTAQQDHKEQKDFYSGILADRDRTISEMDEEITLARANLAANEETIQSLKNRIFEIQNPSL